MRPDQIRFYRLTCPILTTYVAGFRSTHGTSKKTLLNCKTCMYCIRRFFSAVTDID